MFLKLPIERPAQSTNEVFGYLTQIIEWASFTRSRVGYFASLYRRVTNQVRDGLQTGLFENPERMERFAVTFANRYFQALIDMKAGKQPTLVWARAFESGERYWPIVLQHLLLGMNAHINLDLGIAAAQTMRGQSLADLQPDFDKINFILAELIDDIQQELGNVWLTLRLFNRLLGSRDDTLIRFSMNKARQEAWKSAERFSVIPEAEWPEAIRKQDGKVEPLALVIRRPGILLAAVSRIVRVGEVQDVAQVLKILG